MGCLTKRLYVSPLTMFVVDSFRWIMKDLINTDYRGVKSSVPYGTNKYEIITTRPLLSIRAAQLGELSTTAGYPWKLSMSAYLQNFATKNAVFTNLRNKNAVFTHFRDKYAVFTHFCVKNLWFHRYVTICLTRASTYTFRSCFVIILSPQVRA